MIEELLKPVLVVVIGYLLKLGLGLIGVQIDEALFNTLVVAIVTYLLGLIFAEPAINAIRSARAKARAK